MVIDATRIFGESAIPGTGCGVGEALMVVDMHELSVAQSVVDAISERTGERRVHEVRLSIGRLAGVSVDALRFCFELAASGTGVDGAELEIDEPAGLARCASCGAEFEVDDLILLCACGSADVRVVAGQDLRIVAVRADREPSEVGR